MLPLDKLSSKAAEIPWAFSTDPGWGKAQRRKNLLSAILTIEKLRTEDPSGKFVPNIFHLPLAHKDQNP